MTSQDSAVVFEFQRLDPEDFPLLASWLAQPYVERWWNHEWSAEAVERDFGPTARGEEPAEDLLVLLNGRPIGLLQRCRLRDWPDERAGIERYVDVPERSLMIDYLIGDPQLVGRGIGSAMIRAAIEDSWRSDPEADAVVVPVVAANKASWKALENAGLTRVGEGDIEPDNPIDDSLHYIYRIDRPSAS